MNSMYEKIGVIGAGTMGVGLSVTLLLRGYKVILIDTQDTILEKAKTEISKTMMYAPMINKKLPRKSPKEALVDLEMSLNLKALAASDFVVENITEDIDMKQSLYSQLNPILQEETIVAANTSCISITKIGSSISHPERILGIHFMNPVYLKEAAEVIRGQHTSDTTIQKASDLLKQLEIKPIVVKDFPGFVSNRISHLFMNEAAFVVQDQLAEPKDVDEIFKRCFGHKMGPLETADLIGLDTVVDSLKVLYDSFQDPKFRCCPLLQKMVDAGFLGRKSNKGFYEYKS